jgi:hypothetical protein
MTLSCALQSCALMNSSMFLPSRCALPAVTNKFPPYYPAGLNLPGQTSQDSTLPGQISQHTLSVRLPPDIQVQSLCRESLCRYCRSTWLESNTVSSYPVSDKLWAMDRLICVYKDPGRECGAVLTRQSKSHLPGSFIPKLYDGLALGIALEVFIYDGTCDAAAPAEFTYQYQAQDSALPEAILAASFEF